MRYKYVLVLLILLGLSIHEMRAEDISGPIEGSPILSSSQTETKEELPLIEKSVETSPQNELIIGSFDEGTVITDDKKTTHLENWYFKVGMNFLQSFAGLGEEFENELGVIEGVFGGDQLEMDILHMKPKFTMKSNKKIERLETTSIPLPVLGFGTVSGRHQFEFEIGFLALALNTINVKSKLKLTENSVCTDANPDDCPLADMGLVDPETGMGDYKLHFVLNEEMTLFTPTINYDYIVNARRSGRLSIGTSVGMLIASARQKVAFRLERQDVPDLDGERVMEAKALSTATNDMGAMIKLYGGYRTSVIGSYADLRVGVVYGAVDLHRDVDGTGAVHVADALSTTFPLNNLTVDGEPFDNQETNKLELLGLFLQLAFLF